MTVSNEAVEAAAMQVCIGPDENWDDADERAKDAARHLARTMLEAAAPHMLPAPEGVSEAKRDVADLIGRIIAARDDFKNRDMFGARYLADVLADAANALSSYRERLERAERERDEARGVVRDTLWMARRYADGRQSYAVGMYNDAAKIAAAGGYAKGEPDGTLYALDGLRPEYQTLEARAQAAEAKLKELEAPFDWTAEDLVDLMAEAIMDAIDMDTNATDYARAALIALNKEGLLRPNDYREPQQ